MYQFLCLHNKENSHLLRGKFKAFDKSRQSIGTRDRKNDRALPTRKSISRVPLQDLKQNTNRIPRKDVKKEIKKVASPRKNPKSFSNPNATMDISPKIDMLHRDDTQSCSDYAKDIFEHIKKNEMKYHPDPKYMQRQNQITSSMRAVLVDWLVDVHRAYRMLPETLYLTVNVLDRFLSEKIVGKSKLQLVGVTALLIASKYEEIYPPCLKSFFKLCRGAYTSDEILRMEQIMLGTLNFNITVATPYPFMERLFKVSPASSESMKLAYLLSEIALLDCNNMLNFQPSIVAASCVYMGRVMAGEEGWTDYMGHYSGYLKEDLKKCCRVLSQLVQEVYRKRSFKSSISKYSKVSNLLPNALSKIEF